MKSAKVALAILVLLSLFIPLQSAYADIAPPPAPQLGGLEPFGYQKTNVQMVYERVEMEVQPVTQQDAEYAYFGSRVFVTAYFVMHNLGSVSETMQAIFPLESFSHCRMGYGGGNSYTHYFVQEDSFIVTIASSNVPIRKVETDHPYKVEGPCEKMTWAGFDVTFPVNEAVVIKVQYTMETMGESDLMQNIEYILETGAGWAGPIQRGYVIVKFPYMVTAENVLSASTPGYQFLYNEVFWSFENLEPTYENNIQVSIVSPATWQKILSIKRDLRENPKLPEKWLELAQIYNGISTWHGPNVRNYDYHQKVPFIYEAGIAENPNSATLYSNYAKFLFEDCCYYAEKIDAKYHAQMLSLVRNALALDPQEPTALEVLGILKYADPALTFVPPPTILPTATALFTATPSITPSPTSTPVPSGTPNAVIVIHTRIVNPPTSTTQPTPTVISTSTQMTARDENQIGKSTSSLIFGALALFIAGLGAGRFWSKRVGK